MDGPFVKNLTHLSKKLWSRQKYCLHDNSEFIKHIMVNWQITVSFLTKGESS